MKQGHLHGRLAQVLSQHTVRLCFDSADFRGEIKARTRSVDVIGGKNRRYFRRTSTKSPGQLLLRLLRDCHRPLALDGYGEKIVHAPSAQ